MKIFPIACEKTKDDKANQFKIYCSSNQQILIFYSIKIGMKKYFKKYLQKFSFTGVDRKCY